jgi:lauroyl/myristoyl acyltransferase
MKHELINRLFLRGGHCFLTLFQKWKYRRKIKIVFNIALSNTLNTSLQQGMAKRISLIKTNIKYHILNIDYLRFWKSELFDQKVTWSNLDLLESLMEKCGRIIICSFHFGNYYLLPFEIARLGYPITVVVGDQPEQYNLIKEAISKTGINMQVVFASKMTLFALTKELKSGRIVYLLIDEFGGLRQNQRLVKIDFLQRKIQVKPGIGWLHYKLQLPIVPVVTIRIGRRENLINVEEPIEYGNECHDKEAYIEDIVRRLFGVLESYVLQYPEQWLNWIGLKRFCAQDDQTSDYKNQESWEMKKEDYYKISKDDFRIFRHKGSFICNDQIHIGHPRGIFCNIF